MPLRYNEVRLHLGPHYTYEGWMKSSVILRNTFFKIWNVRGKGIPSTLSCNKRFQTALPHPWGHPILFIVEVALRPFIPWLWHDLNWAMPFKFQRSKEI